MPAEIVTHLARRGIHMGVKCMQKMQQSSPQDAQEAMNKLLAKLKSPQAIVTFSITAIVFVLLSSAIEYAIRVVAMNLAIVEDTQPNGAIRLPLKGDDNIAKAPLLENYVGEVEER